MSATEHPPHPGWAAILVDAVAKPGVLSTAYTMFWSYSVGNQLSAWFQCMGRGIEPGPINTFMGWQRLGRFVRRGERALTLCMPVTVRKKREKCPPADTPSGDGAERTNEVLTFTRFIYRAHWFALAQTEGRDYVPTSVPEWDEARALEGLWIERVPFRHADGNCQGYAAERRVAVSPVAALQHKTLIHEVAHVVLGHTAELQQMDDHDRTPVNLREVEAEAVALICCESLGLVGADSCRGYIQHWLRGESIPEKSAQRIFKAADAILRAGREAAGANDGQ